MKASTRALIREILPGLLLLLGQGACDSLWPFDNPYDQRRCDPACAEGRDCNGGACVAVSCGPGNCAGCCQGAVCLMAISDAACGSGGVQCVACKTYQGCQAGQCKLNSGSVWDVTVVNADIDPAKSWDPQPGLPPDPYVEVKIGSAVGKTTTKSDTYTPAWNEQVLSATAGNILTFGLNIKVMDHDPWGADETVGLCKATVSETILAQGTGLMVCGSQVKKLQLKFSAK